MKIRHVFLLIVIIFSITSCRTVKQVTINKNIPSITEGKLLKNIENNELKYSTLFAKRLDISFKDRKGSNNLKASLKIKRDSFIQTIVTAPLGIEVARILLTEDSIKFVDTYHKKYFIADYDYFYDKFDVRVSFDCVQKILTNAFFNFQDCAGLGKEKKYKLDKTGSGYELSTVEERALSRKIKKFYKKKRKNKDFILVLQKILVDPESFRPIKVSVEDLDEEMAVSVNYEEFKNFAEKIFPEKIIFQFITDSGKTSLELKFLKIDFDVPVEPNFRISSKFKRID